MRDRSRTWEELIQHQTDRFKKAEIGPEDSIKHVIPSAFRWLCGEIDELKAKNAELEKRLAAVEGDGK